ncbi:MAG TPA: hypothetical protein VFY14_04815 [Streptomyces sp.]|nr:hypothetical protein [Streptomyces sp.]
MARTWNRKHRDDRRARGRRHVRHRGGGRRTHGRGGGGSLTARRALRREAPSTVAVVADPAGFAAMRRYTTFDFDSHRAYLRQVEGLLRSLTAQGIHTRVGLFDPDDYEHFCTQERIDPDTPDSRTRYVAEIAATGATVRYRDQPLDRLLPLLLEGWESQDAWDRATTLLTAPGSRTDHGAGHGESAGRGVEGIREGVGRAALDTAAEALSRLLGAAGAGTHHLVCSVVGDTGPLVAVLHAERPPDGPPRTAPAEALVFRTVLAAGLATGRPGGVVMRTVRGGREQVRGWSLYGGWLRALTEAEVFAAYCTDARTGEPIPPEPGLSYSAGFPLPRAEAEEPGER